VILRFIKINLNAIIGIFVAINDNLCLQCFDTVGWAAGRASGL